MKCPKCSYISFDWNAACPKCGRELAPERGKLRLPDYIPGSANQPQVFLEEPHGSDIPDFEASVGGNPDQALSLQDDLILSLDGDGPAADGRSPQAGSGADPKGLEFDAPAQPRWDTIHWDDTGLEDAAPSVEKGFEILDENEEGAPPRSRVHKNG